MAGVAEDYAWVDDWRDWGGVGYCLTTAVDLSPTEVLARLGATERVTGLSLSEVEGACWEAWDQYGGTSLFVGVTSCASSAVMVEVNGFVGVITDLVTALSRGTTVVSHYKNVNALDRFLWLVDGSLRLDFEPLFPSRRNGPDSATVEPLLRAVGFDLAESGSCSTLPPTFALAEAISGTAVTPADLDATYLGGFVALPM